MTIILSVVTGDYAVQVSDRLLTERVTSSAGVRYEPWDLSANKSVIVLGSDGLFAVGYSGPGHISGVPTDSWIAEAIAGEDLDANKVGRRFGIRIESGTSTDRVLASRFPELARRLAEATGAGQLTGPVSVGFVGLRWESLDDVWPAYGTIGSDGHQYLYGMSPQRWGYEKGRVCTGATGHSQALAQRLLHERFSGADLSSQEDTAAALIEILRSLPDEDPTVGRDCLITTIQAVSPHVRIKYEPFGTTQMLVESVTTGQRYTFEAAVSPWIITPNHIFAPLTMNGPAIPFSSSGFDFRIEGLESTGDLTVVSSQPRPLGP